MLVPWFPKKQAAEAQEGTAGAQEPLEDDDEEEEWEGEDQERQAIQERVYAWGLEWSKTPAFEALTQEQKDESEYIVESFTEYMRTYHCAPPEEWNVADMEDCCLDTLVRKISAEESYYRSLAPVLASFFTFLGETGRLRNASRMAQRVLKLDKQIIAAAKDPGNWGMAKSFVMAAKAAGVDITNEADLQSFVALYNARMTGRTSPLPGMHLPEVVADDLETETILYERAGPKVGRNDPCPCGSGKKYKKCCGSS
ncbi:MAG TPA: SEC-C metal-binding domain-containing protein [Chthonomonadaceae bacterium]|nr:SEC-C metal-binding domain-containing protein [Chthonomonadaceae bacterium]